MRLRSLTILFCFASFNSTAQFEFDINEMVENMVLPIASDRPGQALNPSTCGIAALQFQAGANFSRYVVGIDNNSSNYFVPLNVRLGFTRRLEINGSFYYNYNQWSTFAGPVTTSGFPSPELGLRFAFLEGERWKPFMALQSNLSFISHHGTYQQQQFGSSFMLTTSNRFYKLSVNTNFGIKFLGTGNMDPVLPYVLNFGYSLGPKWSMFIEGFGEISTTGAKPVLNTDAGIAFTPAKLVQLDLFGGWLGGFNSNAPEHWFVELGVSYKISFLKHFAKKRMANFQPNGSNGFGN